MWNLIGNKHVHPTRLARTPDEMLSEWAAAVVAIREAVRQHLKLRDGAKQEAGPVRRDLDELLKGPRLPPRPATPFTGTEYDLLIGSGGILSHSPRPAAAAVLLDALSPRAEVELAVDSEFMFPHLGALAQVNPGLAVELAQRLGIVKLDRASRKPPAGYVPPPCAADAAETGPRMTRGEIRLTRELAIPGQVFVKAGQTVATDTLVARSVRQFLRPFFLHVAEQLAAPASEVERYLVKRVGDEVGIGDVVARIPRRITSRTFRSPVAGRIERLLPGGTLFLRERPEEAREYTAVEVAKELGVEPDRLGHYLKVKPGDEVDRGQWLAAMLTSEFKFVASPVRGKVNRIDKHFGIVLIEPLLEELEVRAWLPGTVESVSERGCTVASSGTVISGVWGSGGETAGRLTFSSVAAGKVVVHDFANTATIAEARELKAAGLICAGVNLQDVIEPFPPFTIVVLEGFGEQRLSDDARRVLTEHEGRTALLDGTTQLRVGVKRPQVILPDGT